MTELTGGDAKERLDIEKESGFLNSEFKKGTPAHEVVDTIRRFPRPIVVDFNNVIANNMAPLQCNPEAQKFLDSLRSIGNVFIVTTADGWDDVHEFMEENELWSPDIILMAWPNWSFITQHEEDSSEAKALRAEYLENVKHLNWNITEEELVGVPAGKRVAPIFNKPWKVPIIDDSAMATTSNPGMLGIQVKAWEPNYPEWHQRSNKDKPSLIKAVEIVRQHYSKVFKR